MVALNVIHVGVQILVGSLFQLLLQLVLSLRVQSLDGFRAQVRGRHVPQLGLGHVARLVLVLVKLMVELLHLSSVELFKTPLEELGSLGFAATSLILNR